MSKKVLQLILEHQSDCNEEFQRILDVLERVKNALDLCKGGRKELCVAGKQFTTSLGILASYRKRKLAQNLLFNLKTIKSLVRVFCNSIRCFYCVHFTAQLRQTLPTAARRGGLRRCDSRLEKVRENRGQVSTFQLRCCTHVQTARDVGEHRGPTGPYFSADVHVLRQRPIHETPTRV